MISGGCDCTAGFTAIRNGRRGLITAAPCEDQLNYAGKKDRIGFDGASQSMADGQVDLQFHYTKPGHSTNSDFRAHGRTDRKVAALHHPVPGNVACHYGFTTGHSCDEVEANGVCETYDDDKTYCGLVKTRNHISGGGDSGGPWFWGNIAYGIHGAGNDSWFGHSLFTTIDRVSKSLRANVIR